MTLIVGWISNMPVGKEKIFVYFLGLIGLFGVVYTLCGKQLSKYGPDILYVDKETLDVQRVGRYAVLVNKNKDTTHTNGDLSGNAENEFNQFKQTLETGLKEIERTTQKEVNIKTIDTLPSNNSYSGYPRDSIYNFMISKQDIENIFASNKRDYVKAPCSKLFENDVHALVETTLHLAPGKRKKINSKTYMEITQNCTEFGYTRGYLNSTFTETERNFPIAFSIVAYKQAEQVERLLRAIYRPQNHYCIHMDLKSPDDEIKAVEAVASCFSNVYMSSRSIAVQWGTFSVLEAELVCMSDMWNKTWRYFINLTGQEFPLKTNLELVKILSAMKGANLVDGTWVRARENYIYRWLKAGRSPPHNIRPIKGSVHIAVNRDFVDFVLHDTRSKDFLQWLNKTEIPDETFFSSLNHNPHLQIPGSFLGEPEEYPRKPTFTRYKNWEIGHGVWVRGCTGKYVRNVCILGLGDLHKLKDDIGLFANKFYLDYQYPAYECLEELIYNRTRNQYLNELPIDVKFYESLDQARYQFVKKG